MIDFDDLDEAEGDKAAAEYALRAAEEDRRVAEELAEHFSVRLVGEHRVPLLATPHESAAVVGERQVGDVVRVVKVEGSFALLHALELVRVAQDYQDFWASILSGELPRKDEAWLQASCFEPLEKACSPQDSTSQQEISINDAEQAWLSADSEETALKLLQSSLTIVISTSPSVQHCNSQLLLEVLGSLQKQPAFARCRKVLVFDAQPSTVPDSSLVSSSGKGWVPEAAAQDSGASLADAYKRYQEDLRLAADRGELAMQGVEMLFLQEWGHLVGTVRHALEQVSTPFVLLHQHDLILGDALSDSHVLEALKLLAARRANCILLNRDVNFAGRSTQYLQAPFHRPELWRRFARQHFLEGSLSLTPFVGYSDQTQLVRADWLRDRVIRMVGSRKCCMEFTIHELFIRGWMHEQVWERTYLLGGMEEGPWVYDTKKNGNCWADETDAYSEEKEEEVFVPFDGRLQHRTLQHRRLALYIYRLPTAERPGRVLHFPDAAHAENGRSRAAFSPEECG
eukprot:TRINITY_DN23793_c0_g1_i1.p1 TRINITY_DN23793_c0_g1~~TRINITY_DN23793_c0_g1_i1.p1  ORF type:complete len:512 (+),score=101.77 TRINITY_DN23793_c0_g1_i1:69-1604(+)